MKTVHSSANVAHVWANQIQDSGRNGGHTLYFDGPAIFSYGSHWPLAVFSPFVDENDRRIVFVNGGHYGNTTSRHASHVSQALHGHPVRTVDVLPGADANARSSSGMAAGFARDLARGDLDALANVIRALGDAARASFVSALGRRDMDRAAWDLDSMAERMAEARDLADLAPTKERARLAAAAGELPAGVPASWRGTPGVRWPSDPGDALPNLAALLRQARDAHKRATAADALAADVRDVRAGWRDARAATFSAESQRQRANFALEARKAAAKHAKAAGLEIPRGVPSLATITARIASLAPVIATAAAVRDAERLRESTRATAAAYYLAQRHAHALAPSYGYGYGAKPGTAQARARVAEESRTMRNTARNGGRVNYRQVPGVEALLTGARAILARVETFDTIRGIVSAVKLRGRIGDAARAALADLDAAARDALEILAPMAPRLERHAARDYLEMQAGAWKVCALAALADDASADTLRRALATFDGYKKARADAAAAGLPIRAIVTAEPGGVYDLDAARIAERIARAEMADAVRQVQASADLARSQAADSVTRSTLQHIFAAQRDAQLSARTVDTGRARLETARAHLETIGAAGVPAEIRADLARAVADMDAAATASGDALRQASEARAALIASTGLLESVAAPLLAGIAWANRDPAAPRPSGVVFRLAADGLNVESSMGAVVTVTAARRLWALIRAHVEAGTSRAWEYGRGPHVGPFALRSIGADGRAVVGCHDITPGEARRFARVMGWPPFGAATDADALPDLDESAAA